MADSSTTRPAVEMKIKCVECSKIKSSSAFSNRQLEKLPKSKNFKFKETGVIKCFECNSTNRVELKCEWCDKTRRISKFSLNQRHADEPKCEDCVREIQGIEPSGVRSGEYDDEEDRSGTEAESDEETRSGTTVTSVMGKA